MLPQAAWVWRYAAVLLDSGALLCLDARCCVLLLLLLLLILNFQQLACSLLEVGAGMSTARSKEAAAAAGGGGGTAAGGRLQRGRTQPLSPQSLQTLTDQTVL